MIIEPVSVADGVARHLRASLLSGAYSAGQELKDTAIAADLGVARPTARVAVQRLVAEGLLERAPGHSARVRRFTAEDVTDLYRLRRLLEFEAVRIITSEGKPTPDVAAAVRHFRSVGDETWDAGPDADTAFHSAVVHASGSSRLIHMFGLLASEMRLMIALLRPHYGSLGELAEEHEHLLEVLTGGNGSLALQRWQAHLDDAERFLIEAVAA